jgi:hypothetical protein
LDHISEERTMDIAHTTRLTVRKLLGLALCAGLLLTPAAAGAQEGPQFGNWGPGKPAPEQEGVDQPPASALPSTGGDAATAPNAYAAPGAPAPPVGGIAPIPWSGCPYDLRGNWWNEGRQTTGGFRTYSSYVLVRQYRSWIQAVQDDGTSYYGQCLGTRLQFDVYNGTQYVGRQTGSITGNYYRPYPYPYPVPLYGDSAASTAPAPAAPYFYPSDRNMRATFTWTTIWGSGTETWEPTLAGFPRFDPSIAPIPTPITVTPVPTALPAAIRLDALSPAHGPAGTEVIITGSGFAADNNLVTFGPSAGLRHPDGTPGNLVARAASPDGRVLRFTVPANGPSGILCSDAGSCVGVSATLLTPGRYEVMVINNTSGSSNPLSFDLEASPDMGS